MPLSIGANIGLYRRFDQTDAYIDFGTWFHFGLDFGICYRNVLSQENIARILRAGASYTWKQVTATVEIEDSVLQDRIIPHILLSFDQPIRDFNVRLTGGVHYIDDANINDMVVGALEISFRNMIRVALETCQFQILTLLLAALSKLLAKFFARVKSSLIWIVLHSQWTINENPSK